MDAMERLRRRLQALLDDRTPGGTIRQKALARALHKSESWLSNILSGKRGIRLKDLDVVAAFFHLPPTELIRPEGSFLVEVTPTEQRLLRELRKLERQDPEKRTAVLVIAGVPVAPSPPEPTKRRKKGVKESL